MMGLENILIVLIGILGSIAFVQAVRVFELSSSLKKIEVRAESKENSSKK